MTQTPQDTPSYLEMLMRVAKANERTAAEKARADAAEVRIKKLERELNSKKQLLRETDQSRTEVREMYRSVCDVAQEYKDNLELAEAREQRLKELIESIANAPAVGWRQKEAASILLSTLYPDTPAPKEGK
jgi:Iap family predicted aminopeptidase